MSFASNLMNIPVIDSPSSIPASATDLRGYEQRDRNIDPTGGFAKPFNIPLLSRQQMKEMFEERERTKKRIFDRMAQAKAPPLNQNGFSNCWMNGVVDGVQISEVMSGRGYTPLSVVSCSGPIKNYNDQGGWGIEGVKYVAANGIAEAKFWPQNKLDKKFDTPESRASRVSHKIAPDGWLDLPKDSWEAVFTCLAWGFPCTLAHMEWQHLVCAIDGGISSNGELMALCRNSGYGRDSTGHSWVKESFGKPDESLAIQVGTAG